MSPRVSRLLIALVLACAGILLAQGSAHAVCRCAQGGVEDGVNRADAVFSGVLVDSSGTARGGKSEFATYEIEADVLTITHGDQGLQFLAMDEGTLAG